MPLLDVGQIGGSRESAGAARATIAVVANPAQVAGQTFHLPQQNVNVREVMGFTGSTVRWELTLRTDTLARLTDIQAELDSYLTGSLRGVGGVPGSFDATLIRETQLRDSAGNVMATRVRLGDWRQLGKISRNNEWAAVVRMAIEFEVLG